MYGIYCTEARGRMRGHSYHSYARYLPGNKERYQQGYLAEAQEQSS